jgi:DNA-damage-inducible protein J
MLQYTRPFGQFLYEAAKAAQVTRQAIRAMHDRGIVLAHEGRRCVVPAHSDTNRSQPGSPLRIATTRDTMYLKSFKELAMATTTMVHVRVDERVKAQATETLAAMGLSVSDAVRVFLMRVVADKQLPFALKVPNTETRSAMVEADTIAHTRHARFATAAELFDDLEKNSGK